MFQPKIEVADHLDRLGGNQPDDFCIGNFASVATGFESYRFKDPVQRCRLEIREVDRETWRHPSLLQSERRLL